ncbi:Protein CBG20830 [Caenorhabditis briggsae]|uniref:Protein CBG20830 n=1 Tax=Caenorhabditis briggsae TaxID=6238 RepID=A8XYQ7_CAEBR|nr:Protein CBG20830 [Caenorhabditis briggsae]CAP37773.2 Protein CBG20830 [Caenorhabditis briggsae]
MVKRTRNESEKPPPLPETPPPPPVGELPVQYKRMSASRSHEPPPPSNRLFWVIPILICASLIWGAWSQFHDPPEVIQQPIRIEDPNRKRVWWMPDLLKTLPPFAEGYRIENFVPKYKISGCTINGNFPEMSTAIFCYIHNSTLFTAANKTISQDLVENGLCSQDKMFYLPDWKQWKKYITNKIRRVAFVQHPLERFARSFMRHCQRNCHYNREFPRVESLKIGANQTEMIKFTDKLNKILGQQGVPQDALKVIKEEVLKIPMELTEEEIKLMEKVRKDEDLFRIFRYLYEHDYILFGYDF